MICVNLEYIIHRKRRSMSASLIRKPSPGCHCGSLTGTSSSALGTSSSSGTISLKVSDKLCKTAHATIIVVEHSNLVVRPLDKHGNRRFHMPKVLSTIRRVLP